LVINRPPPGSLCVAEWALEVVAEIRIEDQFHPIGANDAEQVEADVFALDLTPRVDRGQALAEGVEANGGLQLAQAAARVGGLRDQARRLARVGAQVRTRLLDCPRYIDTLDP